MTPADFDPYRDQIRGCACDLCNEVAYALSSVTDFDGRRHQAACAVLLAALRVDQHVHKSLAQRAKEARVEKDERLAAAAAGGASAEQLAAIDRGYTKVSARDFYATGLGIGMTPGQHQRRRPPRGPWSPPRPDARPAR